MKLFLALLLAAGLAAAGTAFPDALPGALKIIPQDTVGGIGGGTAYYSSDDKVTMGIINAEKMTQSEWQEIAFDYEDENIVKKSSTKGIEYYYICEADVGEMQCFIDTYFKGTYYTMDLSILDATESATIKVGTDIISVLATAKPSAGASSGDGASSCAPVAMILLALGAAFAGKGFA